MERREFIALMSVAAAGAAVPTRGSSADTATSARTRTVQDAINLLLAAAPRRAVSPELTVDNVKSGDPTQPLKGVVTTFMANVAVIEKAIAVGANLIVTHEPTFYNHLDQTDWLTADRVYRAKRKLLDDHGIVTFRYHDAVHSIVPDPIVEATLEQLGWSGTAVAGAPDLYALPPRSLKELATDIKARLGAENLRVIGDAAQVCRRVGLLVGASGGRRHIDFLSANEVDVLVVGEIAEWETSEYVRDANRVGRPLALIIVGHSASEAIGMKWLAGWLRAKLPGTPVEYVPAPAPFVYY